MQPSGRLPWVFLPKHIFMKERTIGFSQNVLCFSSSSMTTAAVNAREKHAQKI
jgi:hypothetical protein